MLRWFSSCPVFFNKFSMIRVTHVAWHCRVKVALYCDIASSSFFFFRRYSRNMCWGGGERERLPSFTTSHQGGKKQASWIEEEGWGGEKEGKRDKREEKRKRRNKRRCGNWGGAKRIEEGINRERKEEENEATGGVGWERRDGRRWALASFLTLGSFLPNLSPTWARGAHFCLTHDTHRTEQRWLSQEQNLTKKLNRKLQLYSVWTHSHNSLRLRGYHFNDLSIRRWQSHFPLLLKCCTFSI